MAIVRQRRDTAAAWTANNPILPAGQLGYETDTRKSKLGDGTTAWNSLAYASSDGTSGVHEIYVDQAAMIADRLVLPQVNKGIYKAGGEFWVYKGTANGDISDYEGATVIEEPYSMVLTDADTDIVNGVTKYTYTFDFDSTWIRTMISILTPAVGAGVIVDVQFNAVSIYVQKPNINAGAKNSIGSAQQATMAKTDFLRGDEVTFHVTQTGTTTKGKGISLHALFTRL